jgi:hypothetical protein
MMSGSILYPPLILKMMLRFYSLKRRMFAHVARHDRNNHDWHQEGLITPKTPGKVGWKHPQTGGD